MDLNLIPVPLGAGLLAKIFVDLIKGSPLPSPSYTLPALAILIGIGLCCLWAVATGEISSFDKWPLAKVGAQGVLAGLGAWIATGVHKVARGE